MLALRLSVQVERENVLWKKARSSIGWGWGQEKKREEKNRDWERKFTSSSSTQPSNSGATQLSSLAFPRKSSSRQRFASDLKSVSPASCLWTRQYIEIHADVLNTPQMHHVQNWVKLYFASPGFSFCVSSIGKQSCIPTLNADGFLRLHLFSSPLIYKSRLTCWLYFANPCLRS